MKTTKKCTIELKDFGRELRKNFSEDEITSFIITIMGMSDISHRFLFEEVRKVMKLPVRVKYSMIQHAAFYRMLGRVARKEELTGETKYMPMDSSSWESEEDFEKRFIFVVKGYYEGLKEEGKL
jgi:tartrate dehydratase beta subunit/fumarate hydratase class I family protein